MKFVVSERRFALMLHRGRLTLNELLSSVAETIAVIARTPNKRTNIFLKEDMIFIVVVRFVENFEL